MGKKKCEKAYDEEEKKDVSEEDENEVEDTEEYEKEEEGDSKKMEKSDDLSKDDLEKALDNLAVIAGDTPTDRKQALLSKAANEELSKSENDELYALLGGQESDEELSFADELEKSFADNEDLQDMLDVSDYLRENTSELVKSISAVANQMESDAKRQQAFNIAQAKVLTQMGTMLKSLQGAVDSFSVQPARGPKSVGVVPLNKSFAGVAQEANTLSKSQMLDKMIGLVESGKTKIGGESLDTAISKLEASGMVSPSVMAVLQSK